MTLPDERYLSIQRAKRLMLILTKRDTLIDPELREEAQSILRHYPSDYDLEQLSTVAPHVVQQRMDPLHKMVLRHEQQQHTVIQDDHEGSTPD
jgi:hypothetical protein